MGNGVGGSATVLIWGIIPPFAWGESEENHERTQNNRRSAEVRDEHLQNKSH
jgi:hypothetical protein